RAQRKFAIDYHDTNGKSHSRSYADVCLDNRKGYATLDYEDAGWRESKLQKIQLLVNKQPVDAICKVVHTSQVDRVGRQWVTKFKEHVDRQMFGTSLRNLRPAP